MARMALIRFATAAALLVPSFVYAAGILPQSGQQQFDNSSGAFLNGGQLYIYNPGTTTCASTFSDVGLTAPLPCPITLNSAGRIPAIYAANGSLRVRILNSASVLQFDQDNVAIVTAATSGGGGTPIPDSTQIWGTGDIKVRYDDQPLEGYVRMNGRTIGSASSGATERANADTQSLFLFLWGFSNVSVVTGKGGSAAADWAANKQLTLPDMAGRLIGARDDLGNGSAGRITSTTVTGPTLAGATGGTEKGTIAQGNLPNVNFTITATAAPQTLSQAVFDVQSVTHTTSDQQVLKQGVSGLGMTNGSSAVTGTAASGGSGTALNTIAPVMLFTVYVKL